MNPARGTQLTTTDMSFYAWGEQDIGAAVRAAQRLAPGVPCVVLGHSAGGQLAGMSHEAHKIDALVMVAAGSACWKLWRETVAWLDATLSQRRGPL